MRRALLLATLAAAALAQGVGAGPVVGPPVVRQVQIPGRFFAPGELTALVGDTVTWTNGDATRHTVTSKDDAFDSGPLDPGASFSFTFVRPGTYDYHCSIHRFMNGIVHVYALAFSGAGRPVAYGTTVTLRGLAPRSVRSVTIRRIVRGRATAIATLHPDPAGAFSVRVGAVRPAAYRASVGRVKSPLVRVIVMPRVHVAVQRRRGHLRLIVRATPAQPGARVRVEAYSRDYFRWMPLARGRLDGASVGRIELTIRRRLHVRAVVDGVAGFGSGASAAVIAAASGAGQ